MPVLVLIASIYKERKEKVVLYNILLGILATVSLHVALISGILYLFEIFEILSSMLKENKVKKFTKPLICCVLLGVFYCLILFCVMPTEDVFVGTTIDSILLGDGSAFSYMMWLLIKFLEAFTLHIDMSLIGFIISLIYFLVMMFFILRKNNNKKLFLALFISEVSFIVFIRVANHHVGLMLYTFLFALYLVKDELYEKNKKVICIMLCLMFILQIYWSVLTIIPEIKYNYSAAENVADYLKEKDYKNMKIYSTDFYVTAILPYFENNILYNDRGGTTYYQWSRKNKDWILVNQEEFSYKNEDGIIPDIIILHDNPPDENYELLIEKVRGMEDYKETRFDGNQFYKGIRDISDNCEYEGYYVFERVK